MAQITGIMNYHNSPGYEGFLWTADVEEGRGTGTPFLTLLGGLNGDRARDVPGFDFAMSAEYDYPAASQPDISETGSLTLPDAIAPILDQERNTCAIIQESVNITYKKLSTTGVYATDIVTPDPIGLWAPNGPNNQENLMDDTIAYVLKKIARDMNYTFLNGTFQYANNAGTPAKTRGIITGITSSAINANGAELSAAILENLFITVATTSGGQAYQNTPILFMNAKQRGKISKIYGYQPENWEIGGISIQNIITDFGTVGVVYDTMVPNDTILFASLSVCRPVFNPVPNKGRLFVSDIETAGAAEQKMLYGHIGFDYANEKLHGKITNLSIA